MENNKEQECAYSKVVEQIASMFDNVLNRDIIFTIVDSCGGDLNLSVESIMNITSEEANKSPSIPLPPPNTGVDPPLLENQNNLQNDMSQQHITYAAASQSTGAISKTQQKPRFNPRKINFWTDQLRRIVSYHTQGARVLIIMRGAPGSGKSHLARQIVEITIGSTFTNYKSHIFSTDDFFMQHGQYKYERNKLSEAHEWNQHRVSIVSMQGLSPIIVDNTNIELWEMKPYAIYAIRNGYYLEVMEPSTPWCRKVNQLAKRNTHNVPFTTIKRMLDNYQDDITGEYLKEKFALSYPANMVPPVLRITSPITNDTVVLNPDLALAERDQKVAPVLSSPVEGRHNMSEPITGQRSSHLNIDMAQYNSIDTQNEQQPNIYDPLTLELNAEEFAKYKLFLEAQKRIEEMAKVEQEWENGENWDDVPQKSASNISENVTLDPKPPRKSETSEQNATLGLLESVHECNDWSKISMFMPSWHDGAASHRNDELTTPAEKISTTTCMELGDTDIIMNKNNLKVIAATPRDINKFHISFEKEKIPDKRMFDKSSMTNEQLITEAYRCKNEEKHFVAFRKLFKNVPRAALRDIFDNCCGDVNWAVDIVLDSMANKAIETVDTEDLSDSEETVTTEECDCLAAYNIIPDGVKLRSVQSDNPEENPSDKTGVATQTQKKTKKDSSPSESTLQLKRQIEQNVVISDNHYSKHCLKIRKIRRGEYVNDEHNLDQPSTSQQHTQTQNDANVDSANHSDDEENNSTVSTEELEKIVNVHVGMDFIKSLDNMFGRNNMEYPNSIAPNISLPLSILNEINALWMESLMYQFDETSRNMEIMIQQDEEFARQLAMKEAELLMAGKEPAVPDFKEIMDMDLALSVYQKEIGEWRNNIPMDLAAKLTREKLYNLFPDVLPDTLSELLMAHDNNFQATVEVLLISTGRTDILEAENGVSKFVMEKELHRQEKILEKERKALSEVEWPLLTKGEVVQMSTVNDFREEAEQHLIRRNLCYQKAQDYIGRGMTQVANYYSEVASFHKLKYEQSNSLAAASLIHLHALNNPDSYTLDLHFLRVAEARESLDIFLDTHIQKLRETQNRGGPRYHTLFFITGRGAHSPAGPRIKPAVKRRLTERGLSYTIRNAGLLTAKVHASDKMSYQVQVP
ncbi:hypothetical protein K1T71_001184 [Dendrolimus kikuchii]|uniref:Uncharacterized protein n=1 Tax=Dendrolimus kikuchii TaxID=765133 RepID=A0ACC1DHU0_9NEOP|nr:hypothetical protein K1T71_001184 [Dendrolimus kikuchii]